MNRNSLLNVYAVIVIAAGSSLLASARAADEASPCKAAALQFAAALATGDAAQVHQLVKGSRSELDALDKVTAYFDAIAGLQKSAAKLASGGVLPADMMMSPDLATLYSGEQESAAGTLSNGVDNSRFGIGVPTFVQSNGRWQLDVAATVKRDSKLSSLGEACDDLAEDLNTIRKQIDAGQVTNLATALPRPLHVKARAINKQVSILLAGVVPGMSGGFVAGLPGGFNPASATPDTSALQKMGASPDLAQLMAIAAPQDALQKAIKDSPATPPSPPAAGLEIPATGPLVKADMPEVDPAHDELRGPDPRYLSWQKCAVGDYVLSQVNVHTANGDSTVAEMDYLYAVDPNGVLVLTVTETGAPIPDYTKLAVTAVFSGEFHYFSATAVNPADGALLTGLKIGQDAPSPVPAKLPSVKAFTIHPASDAKAALGLWTSPQLPNLVARSVLHNDAGVRVKTLTACHCVNGPSWANAPAPASLPLMLELADPVKGPRMVNLTRVGDAWVGKRDTGLRQDDPNIEVKNLSVIYTKVVTVERDDTTRTDPVDVDFDEVYSVRTLRVARRGHWESWHEVHPEVDEGKVEIISYTYDRNKHSFTWVPGDGGRATNSVKGVPAFRPDFTQFTSAKLAQELVAMPELPLPSADKRTGMETDRWGKLLQTDQSVNDEDRYLAAHLSEPLPKPRRPLAKYTKPALGCTFSYVNDGTTQINMVDRNLAYMSGRTFSEGDDTFQVAAQVIYPNEEPPTLDREYQAVLAKHKNDRALMVSSPAKITVAGLDGIAFTLSARDKSDNNIRTVEVFALKAHRRLRIVFDVTQVRAEAAWVQLRRIMESARLAD